MFPYIEFNRTHLDHRRMTSWKEMGPNSSDAAIQFHSLPFIYFLASLLSSLLVSGSNSSFWRILSVKLWLHCLVLTSQHSASEVDDDSSLLDTCSKNLLSSPFIHTCIQIQKFRGAQRHANRITHPSSLPHRNTHLPFHPKETVHIQTNRRDGYCPNAIILYCPSPWLLRDKGPSVDEASSVWIGG